MNTKNNKILESDFRLLKYHMLYHMLYIGGAVVILLLCFLIFQSTYYANQRLRSQDKINTEEIIKEMDRTYADSMKILVLPFLILIFAYLRLRHIQSISFYRRELGLDNDDNSKQVPPSSAQSNGKS